MSHVLSVAKAEVLSTKATILTIVATLAALGVGLGLFGPHIEGTIIACTTSGIVVVGLISNAIHTGKIEPSAFVAAIVGLGAQVLILIVAFGLISNATASHVLAIVSAVVIAAAQIAHALVSRQVA